MKTGDNQHQIGLYNATTSLKESHFKSQKTENYMENGKQERISGDQKTGDNQHQIGLYSQSNPLQIIITENRKQNRIKIWKSENRRQPTSDWP